MTEPRVVEWSDERIASAIDKASRGRGESGKNRWLVSRYEIGEVMYAMRDDLRATIDAQAQEIATLKAELAKAKREIELINEANAPMRPRAFWDDKMRANKGR